MSETVGVTEMWAKGSRAKLQEISNALIDQAAALVRLGQAHEEQDAAAAFFAIADMVGAVSALHIAAERAGQLPPCPNRNARRLLSESLAHFDAYVDAVDSSIDRPVAPDDDESILAATGALVAAEALKATAVEAFKQAVDALST